jgi:Mce-associated membrane protein
MTDDVTTTQPPAPRRGAAAGSRVRDLVAGDPLRAVTAAAALIALACAAWFGTSWRAAADAGTATAARARDTVLQDAEQAAVNLNTLDYQHARQDLNLWLSSSTGTLHTGIQQDLQQELQVAQQERLVTSATILDGAVTRLDTVSGTANVMLALTFSVQISGSKAAAKFESELGTMRKTAAGWRLSSLCPTSGCTSGSPAAGTSPAPSTSASPRTSPASSTSP